MANSRRDFVYVDNYGTRWAINADESNVEAVNAPVDAEDSIYPRYRTPKNLKLRNAIYANLARTRKIVIPILTAERTLTAPGEVGGVPAAIPDTLPGADDPLAILTFQYFDPEQLKNQPRIDTGLLDGDVD